MKDKLTLLFIACLITATSIHAQEVYYQYKQGQIVDRDSLLTLMDDWNESSESTSKGLIAVIYRQDKHGDSTILSVNFEIIRDIKLDDQRIRQSPQFKFLEQKFPNVNVLNLEGDSINIVDSIGRPTFVNFWFTACQPCLKEIPFIEDLQSHYGHKMDFYAVSFENADMVKGFLENHSYELKQAVNGSGLIDSLEIEAFPISFLMNEKGAIVSFYGGFLEGDCIDNPQSETAKSLLKEIDNLIRP